ncbi:PREDICTED: uncharacterized protein LOC105458587 [Wasmannia auropunctata]|uniref:uncharacterized protein LOC105458587 n=1 Tax=Wasmannia auropunctata TaxID=64793 RepID=UPI0005ED62C7|nr:PREDICTED: uncharacterized protein LOC105458587 [Wasmannia auropunctata]
MVVCGGFRDVNLAALKTPCGPAAPIFVPQQRDIVSSGRRECARTRVFFNRGGPLLLSPPPPPPPSQPQPQPSSSPSSSWWLLLLLANTGAAGERPSVGEYVIPRE